ncbi:MAG TPA: flagellar filament capping protein FliD [Terracidiphilus sp.]|nr:flagellar filament capping protein FliD [Terracidiphilus sp.]
MGTVGLSFGSPTSGAGFDVSSTVAQIVSNLENVETPWKNQLSTLEKQDTVISSLGTLFSNLSNDMSSLTDLQGVLSQKTGSSSNTNVLELMSATASAAAGTYSVVVNSLASTANGYLDPITDASDELTGSITINGTQINVPDASTGDDTLQGLANAVNSASIGVTASLVSDADGSRLSLTSNSSGAAGSLSVTSAVEDNGTTLTYNKVLAQGANASISVNGVGYSVASNSVSTVIPGVTFDLLGTSSSAVQVIIGNDNADVESTVNQLVMDYNSLISAMNTQEGNDSSGNPEPLFGSPTLTLLQQQLLGSMNMQNPNGYLTSIPANANATLAGSITIQAGNKSAQTFIVGAGTSGDGTIYTGSGFNTLSGLADAINSANIGVTAAVVTSNGQSTLTLASGTDGASGALTVTSALKTNPITLTYTDAGNSASSTADSGTVGEVAGSSDTLSGSITIQVGDGTAQTVNVGDSSTADTIFGLANAINAAGIGVTAYVVDNGDGTLSLSLVSGTDGSAGALTVDTSNLTDTTTTSLNYTASSDISSLTDLGISVNNDGTLTLDANSLDSVLNSDYSSVVGFFQNANSWGQNFTSELNNAGVSSSTGVLKLAENSNSGTESTLNAQISKEESLISAQQTSLTAELNSANEIMQQLPSQLQGINELYAAITGYNQNTNG